MRLDWIRSAGWLHRDRTWSYLRFMAILSCGLLLLQLGTSRGGIDRNGLLLGTDFLSFWSAGKLLATGGSPYDVPAHIAMQRTVHASDTGYLGYFYPPVFELWSLPLGYLDYFAALAIWTIGGLAAYAAAARLWLSHLPERSVLVAVAAFPAVLLTIANGQTSLLVSALLGGGLWLVASGRKLEGGVLLGLAVIKPQFGVLIPIVLLAAREWRAILAAGATAVVSATVVTASFGADEWIRWWEVGGSAQAALSSGSVGFGKMQSVYAGLRLLGVAEGPAYLMQAGVALGCAVVLYLIVRRDGLRPESAAATLVAAVLATPFLLDYDLVLLGFPIALLATRLSLPWERAVCALCFAAPVFARSLGLYAGIPMIPQLALALFILLMRRMKVAQNAKGAAIATPLE